MVPLSYFQHQGNWFLQASKMFWTDFVLSEQTRWAKSLSQLVSLPSTQILMKTLHRRLSQLIFVAHLQRSKLTFSKSRLLPTFNYKIVAIKKKFSHQKQKNKREGEDTSWHITKKKKNVKGEDISWPITRRANVPNGTFLTLYIAAVSLRIHVEFLNDKRGKEKDRRCCRLCNWLNLFYFW